MPPPQRQDFHEQLTLDCVDLDFFLLAKFAGCERPRHRGDPGEAAEGSRARKESQKGGE